MIGSIFRKHWAVLRESWREQRKAEREKRRLDQTDFLPAVLEVLETPPNPIGRAILWTLLSFVAIAILWTSVGHIDVVASASGKLIPRGRIKVIQAADGGVVQAIHVVDGQQVKANEPLVVLDATISQADVAQAQESLFVAAIDRARSQALVAAATGREPKLVLPEGTPASIATTQKSLVLARVAEHRTAIAALSEERAQRRSELAMVSAEVDKLDEQLPLAEQQLTSLQKLDETGLVPKMRVAEVKERVVGMRQDLIIRREEMIKSRAAYAGVESQLKKLASEFHATALDALSEADANYRLRNEELKKAREKVAMTVLSSPIDGTVAQLSLHTIGGVVKPADPLMVIVPRGEEMIVEAMVLNKDIGFVHAGQPAEVKLEAFPFTRYGVVKGTIESISTDSVENKELGLVFPCLVKLSQTHITIGSKDVPLEPGFAVTAEIRTGQRRIMELLLSPLSRRLQEAGRER